jgi:hypothetical protein
MLNYWSLTRLASVLTAMAFCCVVLSCGFHDTGPLNIRVQPDSAGANSHLAPPGNQATFSVVQVRSDGSTVQLPGGAQVQWSRSDFAADWVSMNGSTATCIRPAPVLPLFGMESATIQADVTTDGSSSFATASLFCS